MLRPSDMTRAGSGNRPAPPPCPGGRRPGGVWAPQALIVLVALTLSGAGPTPGFRVVPSRGAGGSPSAENAASALAAAPADVRALYAARAGQPLWTRGDRLSPAGEALIRRLRDARDDGLDANDYLPAALVGPAANTGVRPLEGVAPLEATLTEAAIAFILDLHGTATASVQFVDPDMQPTLRTRGDILRLLADSPSAEQGWASATRMNPVYDDLKLALKHYRQRWTSEGLATAASGGPEEIRSLQAAHGLARTGRLDEETSAVLAAGPDAMQRKLLANLYRVRALPADLGGRYVVVNAASAMLRTVSHGREGPAMRVVVGRRASPTPELAGLIRYAVVNPYWNIPEDLVRDQIAPQVEREGLSVLADRRLEILEDWSPSAALLSPAAISWPDVRQGRRSLRVRQKPGANNMMGRVKFMLPNDLGIYLHDTPHRHLFLAEDRALSAGCVRLADADALVQWLLGVSPGDLPTGEDQRLDLVHPTPVYILYLTVERQGGGLTIHPDVYGRDPTGAAPSPRTPAAVRMRN